MRVDLADENDCGVRCANGGLYHVVTVSGAIQAALDRAAHSSDWPHGIRSHAPRGGAARPKSTARACSTSWWRRWEDSDEFELLESRLDHAGTERYSRLDYRVERLKGRTSGRAVDRRASAHASVGALGQRLRLHDVELTRLVGAIHRRPAAANRPRSGSVCSTVPRLSRVCLAP